VIGATFASSVEIPLEFFTRTCFRRVIINEPSALNLTEFTDNGTSEEVANNFFSPQFIETGNQEILCLGKE